MKCLLIRAHPRHPRFIANRLSKRRKEGIVTRKDTKNGAPFRVLSCISWTKSHRLLAFVDGQVAVGERDRQQAKGRRERPAEAGVPTAVVVLRFGELLHPLFVPG